MLTPYPELAAFRARLAELNEIPGIDQIADWMREHEYRGVRYNVCGCPVARALNAVVPEGWRVYSSTERIWAWKRGVEVNALPHAGLVRFMMRFDSGHYPDLVDGSVTSLRPQGVVRAVRP